MGYLVNIYTKEHRPWPNTVPSVGIDWALVHADPEGWIAHTGTECPLPFGVNCETRRGLSAYEEPGCPSSRWDWSIKNGPLHITHYRPILTEQKAEPVQEPEPTAAPVASLLEQLAEAHEAAAQIPDIIGKIKTMLEKYGHTVVPLSPFVSAEFVEPEPVAEPAEDMTDWRNWREGDEVTVFIGAAKLLRTIIRMFPDDDKQPVEAKDFAGNTSFPYWYQLQWHSRPATGE